MGRFIGLRPVSIRSVLRALLVGIVVALGLVGLAAWGGALRTAPQSQSPTDAQATNVRRTVVAEAQRDYTRARIAHWDAVASLSDPLVDFASTYYGRLREVYRLVVAPGQRVLEIGCGSGDLLAALAPAFGVGLDFSAGMIAEAARPHPHPHFL